MNQSERITDEELDAIATLEAAATPGPWRRCGGSTPKYMAVKSPDGYVVFRMADSFCDKDADKLIDAPHMVVQYDNVRLIAEGRNALPKLIAEVKALRKLAGKSKCVDCNSIATCTIASARTAHCTAWREAELC